MKNLLLFFIAQIFILHLQAQHFALSNDRFNIAYIGLDNRISIAIENCPCNSIVLKVDNGTITGKNCQFIYRGTEPGIANITVYKKTANQLKKIGQYAFRIKRIPAPVFKIGPYGSSYNTERKVQKVVLAAQQFVRAELEYIDIDVRYFIDSFSVRILSNDSSKVKTFSNITSKISQQLSDGFSILKKDDIVIFHKIFAKGPDGQQQELTPLVFTIE